MVSERALLVASLPHGPREPLVGTPARRPDSVRRTTCIDQRRGAMGEPQEIVASGRDLLTRSDGTTEVVDAVGLRAAIDPVGVITAIESDPPMTGLGALIGGHVSKGLRGRVDEALPELRTNAAVLHQLLDDFPMAALLSSYGSTREMEDWNIPKQAAANMADLCAGWAAEGTMLDALDRTGIFPIPLGPAAPDLQSSDDALAWHDLEPMVPRSIRRRRRLDMVAGEPLTMDVHFRDSHLGTDELEDVLHEYSLAVALDASLCVTRSEATVRVLPWPECPSAVASAGRIVGQPVTALRELVSAEFKGTSTCTHLNDVLRSLAGATALVKALQ